MERRNFLTPPAKRPFVYQPPTMLDQNLNGSSKRTKLPYQPQPLSVLPGHVSFQLLCNASRIGGVIGKSGSIIKQLQQLTGAKIRIEEAPPDSPDRVITVIAPSAINSKLRSGNPSNGGGDAEEEVDVSKAQEALIKLFERIIEVAAMTDSFGVAGGLVSCRLLANARHAGSVIGKGGKMVEKIRKDSGCKITIVKENLPVCAGVDDEMVEIEGTVSGVKKALLVVSRCLQDCQPADKTRTIGNKPFNPDSQVTTLVQPFNVFPQETLRQTTDLVAQENFRRPLEVASHTAWGSTHETLGRPISRVLHETPRADADVTPQDVLRRNFQPISQDAMRRTSEAVPLHLLHQHFVTNSQDKLPELRMNSVPQYSFDLGPVSTSSVSYPSNVRSSALESERVSAMSRNSVQVIFKLLSSSDRVGGIIGKGGATIRDLQQETGAIICIGETVADCDARLITITASESPEDQHSPAQKAVALVFSRSIEAALLNGLDSGSSNVATVIARLVVPSKVVGCLLGKGGAIVSEIRKVTGTHVQIFKVDQNPKCVPEDDQIVQITGEFPKVKNAIYHVTGRLRDNFFSSTLKSVGISKSSITDTNPYGRSRDSPSLSGLSQFASQNFTETQSKDKYYGKLMDSAPIGSLSSAGLSHIPNQHLTGNLSTDNSYRRLRDSSPIGWHSSTGFAHNQHSNVTQTVDQFGLSYHIDQSAPRLWASQEVAGTTLRGFTDAAHRFTSHAGGLKLGSGSRSAIVTNTTMEIKVPANIIESVYGENGSNLERLRQISGAKVIVHESHIGTSDRIIVISGTPNQTQAAQSLLQASILDGSP